MDNMENVTSEFSLPEEYQIPEESRPGEPRVQESAEEEPAQVAAAGCGLAFRGSPNNWSSHRAEW